MLDAGNSFFAEHKVREGSGVRAPLLAPSRFAQSRTERSARTVGSHEAQMFAISLLGVRA
jgi:hypothetical protein